MSDTPKFDPSKPFTPETPKFDPGKPFTPESAAAPASGGPSWHERLGTGMLDPLYGLSQLGAHMDPTGRGGAELDEMVRKRDEGIAAERKAGGQTGTDWWRLGGNIVSPVTAPLMAIPGGAVAAGTGFLGRAALGAAGGAAGGLAGAMTQPVTSGNFATEKTKQAVEGAAVGLGLGGAGGLLTRAIVGRSPAEVEKYIFDTYKRAIKPTVSGKNTASDLRQTDRQVMGAISSIVRNKAALKFGEEGEVVTGKAPQSIEQFADAIEQTKRPIYQRYDAMKELAGERGATIPLAPAVTELRKIATSQHILDLRPQLAAQAAAMADRLEGSGTYTATVAQDAVQNLNASLKAFYLNPSHETVGAAALDDLVANNLRKGLAEAIGREVGPDYQALRNEYGALSAIEKDVVHRAVVDARKNAGGGLMGNIGDIVSAEEVIRGIVTMNPHAVATGALLKTFQAAVKKLRDPNRAVRKMFEAAEKAEGEVGPIPPPPIPSHPQGGMQPSRPGGPGQNAYGGTSTGVASGGSGVAARPTPLTPGAVGPQPPVPTGPAQNFTGTQGGGTVVGGGNDVIERILGYRSGVAPPDPFTNVPGGGREN